MAFIPYQHLSTWPIQGFILCSSDLITKPLYGMLSNLGRLIRSVNVHPTNSAQFVLSVREIEGPVVDLVQFEKNVKAYNGATNPEHDIIFAKNMKQEDVSFKDDVKQIFRVDLQQLGIVGQKAKFSEEASSTLNWCCNGGHIFTAGKLSYQFTSSIQSPNNDNSVTRMLVFLFP
ncbi:hypothetical protein EX30DRAFT_349272 [Ascodesmis nigricans]|uniref:Uncharacterized protein n=1 Tax=Ascodesmis nigricans TaxID=341454 RepID=A0A4S2MW20_9PEZI|nr:hypothetical protein EX30DRAFT_349272 [Ascodesmis nigricans]